MSAKDTQKNEIRTNRSKARKLPKDTKTAHRTLADFPQPKSLPLGLYRYSGQTCKLLRDVMRERGMNEGRDDFPLALAGEFGMYVGMVLRPSAGFQISELAKIKLAHGGAYLPDDGTWFEVID